MSRLVDAGVTRFERQIVTANVLEQLQAVSNDTRKWIRRQNQDFAERAAGYHGDVSQDPQYEGKVEFSDDDGVTFTEPLFDPPGNRLIQMKLTLAQLHVEPPLRGFAFQWYLPTGWVFTDALPVLTYEEAVSNPLVVTRSIRSPANPQAVGFRVLIWEKFT